MKPTEFTQRHILAASACRGMVLKTFAQLAAVLVAILMAGCAHKPPKPLPPSAPPYDPVALQAKSLEMARLLSKSTKRSAGNDYEIGPADVLEISVFEVPKYSVSARVGGDGTIRYPDLGIVNVAGMSERKIEDFIQAELKKKELVISPQVTVFVKELHAREVTIAGEVKSPGVFPIRGGESLIDLISKAGGLSPTAGSYAYILRSGVSVGAPKQAPATTNMVSNTPAGLKDAAASGDVTVEQPSSVKVDLVGLLMRGESQWNLPLQAGDRVTIPTVGWVHITGLGVDKSGTYQLRSTPNMLRQSIDDAGGLKFAANYTLTMIRRNPDGRQETFSVDYKKVLEDEKYDITVQGGDTIIVNRTAFKTALSWAGTAAEKVVRVGFSIGGFVPVFGNTYGGSGGY